MTMGETNIETSDNSAALSDVEAKIVKQLEYYYGDYNLPKDKFLKSQTTLDDGWVPLSVLLTFKRLKELSSDPEVITGAIIKASSCLLEVSEDKSKIRRNPQNPPPPEMKKDMEERTYNVKRFAPDTKLDDLLEYFGKYGKVENIYMKRKSINKNFRGSIFLTYATLEDAQKFSEAKVTSYNGTELIVETKAEYNQRKQGEMSQKKGGNKGGSEQNKQQAGATEPSVENMTRGALLKITGLDESSRWEDIKAIFEPHAKVGHVDYSTGQTEALVRFAEANSAKDALEKVLEGEDKKLILKEKELTATVLEGEEETQTLVDIWKKRRARFESNKKHKGARNKGGRDGGSRYKGGRGGKRPRQGTDSGMPKSKHIKYDDDE